MVTVQAAVLLQCAKVELPHKTTKIRNGVSNGHNPSGLMGATGDSNAAPSLHMLTTALRSPLAVVMMSTCASVRPLLRRFPLTAYVSSLGWASSSVTKLAPVGAQVHNAHSCCIHVHQMCHTFHASLLAVLNHRLCLLGGHQQDLVGNGGHVAHALRGDAEVLEQQYLGGCKRGVSCEVSLDKMYDGNHTKSRTIWPTRCSSGLGSVTLTSRSVTTSTHALSQPDNGKVDRHLGDGSSSSRTRINRSLLVYSRTQGRKVLAKARCWRDCFHHGSLLGRGSCSHAHARHTPACSTAAMCWARVAGPADSSRPGCSHGGCADQNHVLSCYARKAHLFDQITRIE